MSKRRLPDQPPKARTLDEAQQLIDELWALLVEKDRQANRNSRNSSQPPSRDPPGNQGNPSGKGQSAGKSSRQPGAQPGHTGHRRALLPESRADAIHRHYCQVQHCACGGCVVVHAQPTYRHQVFDLPEVIPYRMEEHQLFHGDCEHCGQRYQATLPETVSPTQMGPNLLALVGTLAGHYRLSISLTRELVQDVFGLTFSTGAYSQAQGQLSPMLTCTHQALHQAVSQEAIQHADETGHQRGREKRWMWLLTSQRFAFFMTHYSRGKVAGKRLLDQRNPLSVLVSDHYAVYTALIDDRQHQLCWAHVLRNLNEMAESPGYTGQVGQRLVGITLLVFRTRHRFEQGLLNFHHYQRRMRRLRVAFQLALDKGSGVPLKRHAGRCEHVRAAEALYWTFLTDERIPLTNNEAERRLRSYVLWRKASYGVRSHRGELFRQRILSFAATCRLQGKSVLRSLQEIVQAVMARQPLPDIFATGFQAASR